MNDIELCNEGLRLIDVDTEKAFECFSKSTEAGNADAMYYLGVMYQIGIGAEMNVDKALEWFEKARVAGNGLAASDIGMLYYYGHVSGLEPNKNRAFPYLLRAAHDNVINSMLSLASVYLFGTADTIPKNYRLAAYWAFRGIEGNDTDCWYLIGLMYEYGLFFEKSLPYAKYCYKMALPLETAKKDLKKIKYLLVIPRKPNLTFDDTAPDFFADELPTALDENIRAIVYGK